MKRLWWMRRVVLSVGVGIIVCGCHRQAKTKKFYWVQVMKGHPVHQLTQIGFKEGCRRVGYDAEVLGTDDANTNDSILQAEQAMARADMSGVAIWAGSPAYNSFIEKAGQKNIPVIIPHFALPEGSYPGARGVIACDPAEYARTAADAIGEQIGGKGTVAITQGSFNPVENKVTASFTEEMKQKYPDIKVLPPQEEQFDPASGVAKATAILQANPDVVAALSTTGGGPTSWAGAARETHRKVVIIGMDYTRVNLDLVRDGKVYAVIAQPLWDESAGAAELLDRCVKGEKISWWTKLPAPLVTKDKIEPYYQLLDKVSAAAK